MSIANMYLISLCSLSAVNLIWLVQGFPAVEFVKTKCWPPPLLSVYDKLWAGVMKAVPKLDESESGQMV